MVHEYTYDEGTRGIGEDGRMGTLEFSAVSTYFFLVSMCIPPKSDMFDHQQSSKQGVICAGDQNGGQLPDMIALEQNLFCWGR